MFRSNFVIDLAPSSDWMVSSLLCVCVCVCFAVQHRMWQSPRQRHRWLCDARNSNKPKNPQKPRKTQGLGGVEGGEGRGFIFPTNSFIWLWAGRIRPNGSKTLSTPPKKKRKKKKKLHFSAGWNLEHSISLLHAAQSGQCVFPRISLMSGSAPKASGAQIYRMWIVSFCQINCSLNQKLLSIFLSLTSIVIRLYPRCFKVSNLSPPVFTFNWILCSKNSK